MTSLSIFVGLFIKTLSYRIASVMRTLEDGVQDLDEQDEAAGHEEQGSGEEDPADGPVAQRRPVEDVRRRGARLARRPADR